MILDIEQTNAAIISPYAIPGLRFKDMPEIDQKSKAWNILVKVAEYFKISPVKIVSKSRNRMIVEARYWAIWFIRCNTKLSLKDIGGIIGNRDHTSIIHALATLKGQLQAKHDNDFKAQYKLLITII